MHSDDDNKPAMKDFREYRQLKTLPASASSINPDLLNLEAAGYL